MDEDDWDGAEEQEEPVFLECPTCGDVEDHAVVRAAASGWTVECLECHTKRTVPAPPKPRTIQVPVILSQGAAARTIQLEVPLDDPIGVDAEAEAEGQRIRITALERRDGTRPKKAPGRELKMVYAVVYDTVRLRYTVNEGDLTRSFQEEAPPEEEIHVGIVREVQGLRLVVKTLKSDQNRTLHRGYLLARNVRRIFADVAPRGSKIGQAAKVRRRGAPKGQSKPRSKDKRPGPMRPRRA
ncbi:MAG: hypothetical protein QOI20_3458 [Acidimicrobiaceae bacterium]|jgi:uncharacterized Zn finger protein|nr:hypothetical protein [Acidimicrobiaceae bacterium]